MALRLDVRRLAAVDMYGSAGTRWRRWVILVEFVAGVVGLAFLAVRILGFGGGPATLLAVWSLGIAANYIPLALHAISLIRPGALEAEVAAVDLVNELRYYTWAQFAVLVPLMFVVLAVRARLAQARR
jgi:hypothetical protein